jgi:hypothetical protein
MRNVLRTLVPLIITILISSPLIVAGRRIEGVLAQEADPAAVWLTLLNRARLDNGLVPYSLSRLLTAAAQRHADDIAAHGLNPDDPHRGSDGSLPPQRITAAGYAAWTSETGELIAGESIWIGEIEEGLATLLQEPSESARLLSALYREAGIGVAVDASGQHCYVLTFGARPNVLPIFINDDAPSTDDPLVALHLSNEEARPGGQGAIFMGKAIEIRISNEPAFDDLPWQSWEPFVPWTLPNAPGEHTVYVQFRDAAGRTAAAADTIVLSAGTAPVPEVTPEPVTVLLTPSFEASPMPTIAEAGTTPAPTIAVTPRLLRPSPTPLAQMPLPFTTLFPTWTPLPTETSTYGGESAPDTTPPWMMKLKEQGVTLLVTLQMVVLVLGVYKLLRRG